MFAISNILMLLLDLRYYVLIAGRKFSLIQKIIHCNEYSLIKNKQKKVYASNKMGFTIIMVTGPLAKQASPYNALMSYLHPP